MGDDTENTRRQIAATRADLGEKLLALEDRIRDDVQNASDAVTQAIDGVANVASSIHDSVDKTVESVRYACDLQGHVQRRPLAMFGAATAAGFTAALILHRRNVRHAFERPIENIDVETHATDIASAGAAEYRRPEHEHHGFSRELSVVKGLAIGVLLGMVRDFASRSVPPVVEGPLHDVFNAFTIRLGGQPVYGRLFQKNTRPSYAMQDPPPAESASHQSATRRDPVNENVTFD
jgi:tetrahydromethanopterin S-methyltransferase subunit F